jgi:hypothetical protein
MIKTSTILKLWMLPSLTLTVIALSPFSKQYVIERFCSYLWVVVLIPVGRIRSLFDKFQTGCVWEVCSGADGFNLIFKMSVGLHGKQAQESTVLIDTTVQERNITYPTDAKLAKNL